VLGGVVGSVLPLERLLGVALAAIEVVVGAAPSWVVAVARAVAPAR
jgi:hypothetical protein